MKKRQLHKIICLLLIVCMVLPALAGCGKKKQTKKKPSDGERVTLTVGLPQSVKVTDYYDNVFTKYVEEQLNMDLEFEFFSDSAGEYSQQFTLLCTEDTGNLPDVVWGFTNFSRATMNQLGEDGFIIDLTDLIKEHAPNFNARLDGVSKEVRQKIMARGKNVNTGGFYAMPTYTESDVADYMQDMMFINKTWLDKVGMKAPTNVNELYNVLKAFKDNDVNGNGDKTDEIPMFSGGIFYYIINAYVYYSLSTNRWNVTDGKVWNPSTSNEYRKALIFINKLVKEGLISDLSLTVGGGSTDSKNLISGSGKEATVGIWKGLPILSVNTSCECLDQYTSLAPLADETGKGGYGAKEPNYLRYSGMITKDCENPEAAMRFLDFFYLDETAIMLRHGQKGVDWEEGSGESAYRTPAIIKVLKTAAELQEPWNHNWGLTGTTWMTPKNNLAIAEYIPGRFDGECTRLGYEAFDTMQAYKLPAEETVDLVYTDEQQKIKDSLENTYLGYITEAMTLFINGTMDPNSDADWKTYLDTVKGYGEPELQKVYQDAYDYTKNLKE